MNSNGDHVGPAVPSSRLIVATERLGWPTRGWRALPHMGFVKSRLQYESEPERPTATCHLQSDSERSAVCGFPWVALVSIPSKPAWYDLHPDLRCDECSAAAELTDESQSEFRFGYYVRFNSEAVLNERSDPNSK